MVDHGRCCEPSLCLATHTQGMPAEVRLAESLPPAAVSTLGGRRSVWMQELMLRTIQTVCQIGTAGVLTWFHSAFLGIRFTSGYNESPCGTPQGFRSVFYDIIISHLFAKVILNFTHALP